MNYTPLRTVLVSKWELKKHGLWEDAKRKTGVTDDVMMVRLIVGTKLKRNDPP